MCFNLNKSSKFLLPKTVERNCYHYVLQDFIAFMKCSVNLSPSEEVHTKKICVT